MPQNTLLMERKSGETAEIRNLQEKIAQLNQAAAKITDDKVRFHFEEKICVICIVMYRSFLERFLAWTKVFS